MEEYVQNFLSDLLIIDYFISESFNSEYEFILPLHIVIAQIVEQLKLKKKEQKEKITIIVDILVKFEK